jgi:hypothetical protein
VVTAVSAIQNSVSASEKTTATAVSLTRESSGFAEQSGESLSLILRMAENAASEMNTIATIIQEQLHISQTVRESMGEIGSMAQNTVEGMRRSIDSAATLAEQSIELKALIEDMRQERRDYPRFILETPAPATLSVNGSSVQGEVLDVSRYGARVGLGLHSVSSPHTGDIVVFSGVKEPFGTLLGRTSGKICWVDGQQFGVELDSELKTTDGDLERMASRR